MTWSAKITDSEGKVAEGAWQSCQRCKHGQGSCYLPKISSAIGTILTGVDTGADGWMASGNAILKCNGFQLKEG